MGEQEGGPSLAILLCYKTCAVCLSKRASSMIVQRLAQQARVNENVAPAWPFRRATRAALSAREASSTSTVLKQPLNRSV